MLGVYSRSRWPDFGNEGELLKIYESPEICWIRAYFKVDAHLKSVARLKFNFSGRCGTIVKGALRKRQAKIFACNFEIGTPSKK